MQAVAGNRYAQILNGLIHWLFGASDLPEWADDQIVVADITGVLPAPGVGWSASLATGGVWSFAAPPAPPAPTLAQQATAAVAAGLTISSTATPALNATWPASGSIWADLKDEALFIQSFGGFSTGTASMTFVLPGGTEITFTETAQLQAVVRAIGVYLTALKAIITADPGSGSLPPASATIA